MEQDKIYESPVDENGKKYWVPVVIKSKDFLVGVIYGFNSVIDMCDLDDVYMYTILGSDRFTDVLPNGKIISEMTDQEYEDYIKNALFVNEEDAHPDNEVVMDYFFEVECGCGNFHGFKTPEDLPNETTRCELCGKLFIHYTSHYDQEYKFNGKQQDVAAIVEKIKVEMGINDDDDEKESWE